MTSNAFHPLVTLMRNVPSSSAHALFTSAKLRMQNKPDVTSLVVALYPPESGIVDFGHIDIFLADNAEALVWMPILDWVNDHSCRQRKGHHSWKKD